MLYRIYCITIHTHNTICIVDAIHQRTLLTWKAMGCKSTHLLITTNINSKYSMGMQANVKHNVKKCIAISGLFITNKKKDITHTTTTTITATTIAIIKQ